MQKKLHFCFIEKFVFIFSSCLKKAYPEKLIPSIFLEKKVEEECGKRMRRVNFAFYLRQKKTSLVSFQT